MKQLALLVVMVIGLALMLNSAASGGASTPATCSAPGCNSTVSDANGNTAGGTATLLLIQSGPTGGFFNTAFGDHALEVNGNGDTNTACGASALRSNTAGGSNTASGARALGENTTGNENTAVGFNTLPENAVGIRNIAVGTEALVHSTGNKNIALGFRAGINLLSGHNNIYLGNQGVNSSEFQTMRLGSTQTQTFIAGIANASVANAATVIIDTTTGQLGIPTSSARYKRDIETMASRSEGVLKLRPVTFVYKDEAAASRHYGLIAEEVAMVYPELVTRTAAGDVQTVKYHELIPMLLNELQREHQDVAMLRKELAELRALVAGQLAGQRAIAAGPLLLQSETDEGMR